jgi:SAM-dependent methyltransferase
MAATLLASAALTRLGLSTPELRARFSSQGVDAESVRVQAAECALLAADAYQWLDAEPHHWGALLEAAWLLQGSAFPERLIQAFQLVSLARNNRMLYRALHQSPRNNASDPPAQFEGYPLGRDDDDRRTARERMLFDDSYRAWMTVPGRVQISDDPGTVMAHGYVSHYAPNLRKLFRSSSSSSGLQIELEADAGKPANTVERLLAHVATHYREPAMARILDFGCGAGDDARHLAKRYQVWAVDSPLWFSAARRDAPSTDAAAPRFVEMDLVEYAGRVRDSKPPDGSPAELDVVLFRCSLCRISQRALVLEAAHKLLRPGGLVVATDWIQTRVTDRITWSRIVGTGRFVDLEIEPGYRRLCDQLSFTEFVSWQPCAPADKPGEPEFVLWENTAQRDASVPAMQRWFLRRLEEVRRLEDERSVPRRSSYDRAFLLRLKRDLEAFVALSGPEGPLGWLFWAARKPSCPSAGAPP